VEATGEVAAGWGVADDEALGGGSDISAVIWVPSPVAWQRAGTPGGLSLLERQLKQLRKLGVAAAVLLVPEGDPEPEMPRVCAPARVVRLSMGSTVDLSAALVAAVDELPSESLAMSADRLVDLRVLRALLRRATTTFASVDGSASEPVAWIHAAELRRHGEKIAAHAQRLPLATLDLYNPELRGTVAPYVIRCSSPDERRVAWHVLLDHVQKRALDLPGQYFDTPFENFLVRRFAPTDISPNQITLATLIMAGGVAVLFLRGWLCVGVLLALVVGVLDGVDGKLARLKLATSKLGEFEHVGDFFYENAWYLTLAWHLHAVTQRPRLWYAGVGLVACDLIDSLLYLVLQRHTGKMLDELTTFDRRFRAIAGRRNVYVMIFVAGFFSGYPTQAFSCAVAWAAVTVAVHASRVLWVVSTTARVPHPA
jgi:phosphatidylglycerophosphate synthase